MPSPVYGTPLYSVLYCTMHLVVCSCGYMPPLPAGPPFAAHVQCSMLRRDLPCGTKKKKRAVGQTPKVPGRLSLGGRTDKRQTGKGEKKGHGACQPQKPSLLSCLPFFLPYLGVSLSRILPLQAHALVASRSTIAHRQFVWPKSQVQSQSRPALGEAQGQPREVNRFIVHTSCILPFFFFFSLLVVFYFDCVSCTPDLNLAHLAA